MYLDTFYHGYFPGAGIPFLYSFGCTTPFYSTFHSLRSDPHAFARRGYSCPLSCLPPASHCSRNRRLPAALRKPAVELPVMTLHAGLFGLPLAPFCRFNVKGVAGLPTSCRHYGESVPACVLRTRPSEARRFVFYFFTTAFGRSHNHFPPQR